jgi:hypothetical protein
MPHLDKTIPSQCVKLLVIIELYLSRQLADQCTGLWEIGGLTKPLEQHLAEPDSTFCIFPNFRIKERGEHAKDAQSFRFELRVFRVLFSLRGKGLTSVS